MPRQALGFWKAGSIVAAATLLVLYPVAASPRLVSLAFNSQLQSPQQMGADELRQKLGAAADKHIVLDERATNALGSENAILAATQSGAVDMAVLSGSVVSAVVPELGVRSEERRVGKECR